MFYRLAILAGGSLLFLALAGTESVRAQQEQLAAETDLKQFDNLTFQQDLTKLYEGEKQPTAADQKLIELAAKAYVYYMTLKTKQSETGALQRRRDEFKGRLIYYSTLDKNRAKNEAFRKLLAQELSKCFQRVFALDFEGNYVSIANTAQMLPAFGELGEKESGKFFVSLIKDPKQSDVVKLFAFKAMQEFFVRNPARLNPFAPNKTPEAQAKDPNHPWSREELADLIDPVIDFILKSPANVNKMSAEEMDGYRFIRCEAIKVLGKIEIPWIPLLEDIRGQKPKAVRAPVAYALLRVLADGKEELKPAPSFVEHLEAAIGLCQINAKQTVMEDQPPRYNPDLAVALVGKFLIEGVRTYERDREERKAQPLLLPMVPWKTTADRLRKALEDFTRNLPPKSNAEKDLARIVAGAKIVVEQLRAERTVESPGELRDALRQMAPPNPVVYRDADYRIQVKWPPEEGQEQRREWGQAPALPGPVLFSSLHHCRQGTSRANAAENLRARGRAP